MSSYVIEIAGGLHAFKMQEHWYCFLGALAKVVSSSKENISVVLKRHQSLLEGAPETVFATSSSFTSESEWERLLETYKTVTAKLNADGRYQRKKVHAPHNLTLYPLESAVRLVKHYAHMVDEHAEEAINAFWAQVRSEPAQEEVEEYKASTVQNRQDETEKRQHPLAVKREREPVSYLKFPTIMQGHRIIIDLTRIGEGDGDADSENVDALLSALSDNFLASVPPASVDSPLKRTYRLPDRNISVTLKDQCIKFGEWRSALWSWSRDDAPVSSTTFDGNISNLLLFAGYATAHAPIAQRIKPPLAFDLSVVFGSQQVLEPLVIGYLRWLRRDRRVMFATTEGYLNSLVVMANFFFADTANSSFDAGRNGLQVKSGLRRLRSHAHAAAQKEGKQKPVHPYWIS